MNTERDYLYLAAERTGCVVMVRRFDSAEKIRRSKIEYLSENADIFGMNIKTFRKGYRLPEDYIHPEDRAGFADAMRRAFISGNDFPYELRLIGDDGVLHRVNMDVIFLKNQDNDYLVEYICREIKSLQTDQQDNQESESDNRKDVKLTSEFIQENRINDYFDNFAGACELYSTVLDMNGHIISEPTGPTSYFGEFYNYLGNPEYGTFFMKIKNSVVQDSGPLFMEMEDGKTGNTNAERRLAAAPIAINGICCGIWLLYAHNAGQAQKLFKVYRHQWEIASTVSDHLTRLYNRLKTADENRYERDALEFEIKEKKLFNKMLSEIDDGNLKLGKYLEKAGKLLGVDHVVYYMNDPENAEVMNLVDFWSSRGKNSSGHQPFEWNHDHYDEEFQKKIREEGIVIDRNNMTNRMRVEVFEGNARAVMVFPVKKKRKYIGRLIFIENTRERAWTESEISFAKEMTKMLSKSLSEPDGSSGGSDNTDMLYTVFDALDVAVFVRNEEDGRIVYANPVIKDMIKMDLIGVDSFRIVPKMTDEVTVLSDNPDVVPEKKLVTRFKRYINQLGGIFDVTEIYLNFRTDEQMAAIILVPAVD